jgi:hypothetical protein
MPVSPPTTQRNALTYPAYLNRSLRHVFSACFFSGIRGGSEQPSTSAQEPSRDVDGWVERTSNVAGRITRWLERTVPDEPGTTEQFFPDDSGRRSAPARVLLSSRARETISHTAAWQSGVDGLETGGWLMATAESAAQSSPTPRVRDRELADPTTR